MKDKKLYTLVDSIIIPICGKEKLSSGKALFRSLKYVQHMIYPFGFKVGTMLENQGE